jgi:hypothetical protein
MRMKIDRIAGILLVLCAATASPAAAQANRADMAAARDKAFPEADADHDGTLSSSEWEKFQEAMQRAIAAARFKRVDANNDGKVSREELDAAQGPRFKAGAGPAAAMRKRAAGGAAAANAAPKADADAAPKADAEPAAKPADDTDAKPAD